jgi:histidyl-tRNA synthetase
LPSGISDIVFGMGAELRGASMQVATALRSKGNSVDLVLEDKRMKWVFKHAERTGAKRLVLVMPEEWGNGKVRVKDLESGDERDVDFGEL